MPGLHQCRNRPHATPGKGAFEAAKSTAVELAGSAFVDLQLVADFLQTAVAVVSQANNGTIARRQAGNFLVEDLAALPAHEDRIGSAVGRVRDCALEVLPGVAGRSLNLAAQTNTTGIPPDGIQHFAANTKPGISGQMSAGGWRKRALRLHQANVAGLNQIRHFDS